MGYFPRNPRPPKVRRKRAAPRPKDWQRLTHVCIAGTYDGDGEPICSDCGFRADHKIHDLNTSTHVEATELERRKLGEGSDGQEV